MFPMFVRAFSSLKDIDEIIPKVWKLHLRATACMMNMFFSWKMPLAFCFVFGVSHKHRYIKRGHWCSKTIPSGFLCVNFSQGNISRALFTFTPTWTPRKGETLKYENRSFPESVRLEFCGSLFFLDGQTTFLSRSGRSLGSCLERMEILLNKTMPIEAWWSFLF